MSTKTATSGGIGFCSALFLLFLVLRLSDHIDWAWYWVAAPLWMPVCLMAGFAALAAVLLGIAYLFFELVREVRKRRRFNRAGEVAQDKLRGGKERP